MSESGENKVDASMLSSEDEEDELFNLYCPTCLLSFQDNETYKAHYKSDLHNYNMKRKLLNLRPANPEEFEIIKKSKKDFFLKNFFRKIE